MRPVIRQDIQDFQTYADVRDEFRKEVMVEKALRRIHVGPYLTFLFESTLTIRYQIQEMMRLEKMAREADILHEMETYNALLGAEGELGCSLLIEIEDESERDRLLRQWLGLLPHLYIEYSDGVRCRARWDEAQVGEDRLSSVQYLVFPSSTREPVAIGCDFESYSHRLELTSEQRRTLGTDLSS
jgi:hypothetical protein